MASDINQLTLMADQFVAAYDAKNGTHYSSYSFMDVLPITASIAASTSANLPVAAQITFNSATIVNPPIPATEIVAVLDLYTKATGDIVTDAQAEFVKNGRKVLAKSAPLSALYVNNQQRPSLSSGPLMFLANDSMGVNVLPVATSNTVATTDLFYASVKVYDSSFYTG